jgi:hypothetical protein
MSLKTKISLTKHQSPRKGGDSDLVSKLQFKEVYQLIEMERQSKHSLRFGTMRF